MNLTSIMRPLIASTLFLTSVASGVATPLSPQQALARLRGDQNGLRMSSGTSYKLAYTETAGNDNILYVFNTGTDGFVIAAADDRMPVKLGYSDSGSFDPDHIPPQLKDLLEEYAREATYYFSHESESTPLSTTRATRANIPALISTQWNQSDPYNLDCPLQGGARSVTGCVATAMAQVIKYHNYPATGSGTHEYICNGETLSFDYGATVFDYANMLDRYDDSASEIQKKAVANLMYGCGVGVNMKYTSGESGAFDIDIPYALKTFFNYDAGVRLLKKIYYSTTEWEELVYNEIAEGRPVIYSGQAANGGHEFVCDGYTDGYFHINWGWGGYCDGNFLLSALNPDGQGIGGFAGGYNSDQGMVCGITPATGASATPWYQIYVSDGLSIRAESNSQLVIKCSIYNYSPDPATVDFYLKTVSESGEVSYSDEGTQYNFDGSDNGSSPGYGSITVNIPSGLSAGQYKAYLVMKTPEGNFQDVLVPQTGSAYFDMTVGSDGKISFADGEPAQKAQIRVENFAAVGTVETDQSVRVDIYVKNLSDIEYSGVFEGYVYKHDTVEKVDRMGINISIPAMGDFNGYITHAFPLENGQYDVIFYDMYGDQISNTFTLWVGEAPVEVTGISIQTTNANIEIGSTLQLNATVTPGNAANKNIIWSSSNNEIVSVDENGLVTALSIGEATITAETSNGLKATCTITVTPKVIDVTGITLDTTEAQLVEGESLILSATVDPENATDKTVSWSSSDNEIATVGNGMVTALKAGTVTITAETSNGLKATCTITVTPKEILATSISIDKESIEGVEGTTVQLTATVLPDDATNTNVTWESSDERIATVDGNGLVTIHSIGSATIIASTTDGSNLTATCNIYGFSGIDAILLEVGEADVYTIKGVLLKHKADKDYISTLDRGIYIIRVGNKNYKVVK